MVSQKEKQRMSQFLCDRIEDSQRYGISEKNDEHILVTVKESADSQGRPVRIYVVLHNFKRTIPDYKSLVRRLWEDGVYTCDIFYKDGELFHVRLGARGNFKGDERILKHYSDEEINKMISLRGLEKEALTYDFNGRPKRLVYYQPKSDRLEEAIRGYELQKVRLNYSHITREHRSFGFVENRDSIDYKIADEIFAIPKHSLCFGRPNKYQRIVLVTGKEADEGKETKEKENA